MRPALVLFAVYVADKQPSARADGYRTRGRPTGPITPHRNQGEQWTACRRWVPWLRAYTRARVGELTQLRAGDVQARQGPAGSIWVLRLTPDAGTIKTGRARTVPLHADLVHQEFPEFAQGAQARLRRWPRASSPPPGRGGDKSYRRSAESGMVTAPPTRGVIRKSDDGG
jgi:hypothetical protein